jgi:hypothetical protein
MHEQPLWIKHFGIRTACFGRQRQFAPPISSKGRHLASLDPSAAVFERPLSGGLLPCLNIGADGTQSLDQGVDEPSEVCVSVGHATIRDRKRDEVQTSGTTLRLLTLKSEFKGFIPLEQGDDVTNSRGMPTQYLLGKPLPASRMRHQREMQVWDFS